MIDHLSVVVSDLATSKAFYLQALAPTGHSGLVELSARPGGHAGSAGFCHADGTDFWISQGAAIKVPIHVAFRVPSRDAVDAFIAAGGKDNGAAGLRPHYHPNYYGAFVLDPNGNNIEAVCHESQWPPMRSSCTREA